MDRLIRECQSIVELNRIIDRGLDDETYQLAMDKLFELVLEGERDAETTAPANDAGIVVSPENTAVMDDTAATPNGGYNLEGNGPENNHEMDETIPSTSTGATSFVDVINSMDDVESLNRIIDEDNWTTEASGVAFQRILELAGVEDFDELIRGWSNTVNEEMQWESTTRLDDLMEVIDADNMAGGDNPVELDQNVSDYIILPFTFVFINRKYSIPIVKCVSFALTLTENDNKLAKYRTNLHFNLP